MTNTEIQKKAEECRTSPTLASHFIRDMEPFIRSVSSRFSSSKRGNLFRDDIFVSAEMGFYNALMNFDFSKRGFISYARKAIEIEVRLFLSNETRTVRLPRYVTAASRRIGEYRRVNGDGDEEGEMKAARITSKRTYRLVESASVFDSVSSLDSPVGKREDGLVTMIGGGPAPEEILLECEKEREIYLSLESLSPSERYIIIHSFGLGGETKKKNSVMASALGVTTATVISRRKRALEAMKERLLPLVT